VWQRRQLPPQQATTGPTLMEEVERTNVVVVRGSGQGMGAPRRDSYAMEVDRGGTVMLVGVLGTWSIIAETGEEEERWKEKEWNMEREDLRAILNRSDI